MRFGISFCDVSDSDCIPGLLFVLFLFLLWTTLVMHPYVVRRRNFSTSLCTDITTPLTTSVAGQVKNVLQTVLGFFSWGYVFSPINAVGLVLALMGQCWFAWIKYSQRHLPAGPAAGGFPVTEGDGAVATSGAKAVFLSQEKEEGGPPPLTSPQGRRPAPVPVAV